ncbi:unnamed protein product, partial [Iphiclides podalirius]
MKHRCRYNFLERRTFGAFRDLRTHSPLFILQLQTPIQHKCVLMLSSKMQVDLKKCSCFSGRAKCLVIGYLHLLSSLFDIGCHLLLVSIVTSGFQCDMDVNNLLKIDMSWFPPLLIFINLGTHGFYPFPMILSPVNSAYSEPTVIQPKCYPGMLHVYLIDVLNFLINVIWLRLVISFISAVHKKDPEQMRMFFGLSIVKLTLQVFYLVFQPNFRARASDAFWFLQLLDICIAATFLIIINNYIRTLRAEKAQAIRDQPPSYIECLISSPANDQKIGKKELDKAQPSQETKKGDAPAILPI